MKSQTTVTPGTFGVFLWDEANPPKLWEFQGINATGEAVFSRGSVTKGDFELTHQPLSEFWGLASF